VFEIDGKPYNLGVGEWFIPVLSATCEHCISEVPLINELTRTPGFPQTIGLCQGGDQELDEFRRQTAPEFPLAQTGIRTFDSLIGGEPPRYYYVRDGRAVAFWDEYAPDADEVLLLRPIEGPHVN
jgi:hypothetical protein